MDLELAEWVPDLLAKRKPNTPDDRSGGTDSDGEAAQGRLADEVESPDDRLHHGTTERPPARTVQPIDDGAPRGG
ncbi:hypothetical protein ACFWY6_18900 [Streptomyces sp. NPDC059037]|uniref:hypothetical protein n=1 Tax=Streptomyces sp. NPDC059037 TaxID=3346710 RepID=UPI0036BF46DD